MDEVPARTLPHIGVLLEDPVRVEGLRTLLSHVADIFALSAPELLRREDLSMALLDGDGEYLFSVISTLRRARPGLRLLVLGSSKEAKFMEKVIAAGVKGYVAQSASLAEIETAISVVADGSIWAPRKVLASLIDTYSPTQRNQPGLNLTLRERQVLRILVSGRSNQEIAEQLSIEAKTVKVYVGRLLQKLGVPNRVALTVRALEIPDLFPSILPGD